jgi:outer membrane protein
MRGGRFLAGAVLWVSVAFAQGPPRLTLSAAEAAALANHPRILAAKAEASAAEQQAIEQKAALFPAFFGSVTGAGAPQNTRIGAGALNNPSIYSRVGTGFTASQLITDFGRTGNLIASARLRAAAERDLTGATTAAVLLAVDQTFLETLRAQAVLQVAEETVRARQSVADQVTALANSKLKSGLDVSFANVNLEEAKLLLVSARNDVDAAFAQLSAAMGYQRPQRFDLADEPLPAAPPGDFSTVLDTAIRKRPELAGLQADMEAAGRFVKAERYLWLPSVSAVSSLGFIPGHVDGLPDRYAAAGLNINVPVFNGHLFTARRREAEFRAEVANQQLRDEQLAVARDVRVAWLQAQTAFQRLDLTAQLLNQASKALDLAQARYQMGLSSIVELSQAQLGLTSAQIGNVSARYDYQIQHAALEYQMGELR